VQLNLEVEGGSNIAEGVKCGDDLLVSSIEVAFVCIPEHPQSRGGAPGVSLEVLEV
jgi:hypothetical protein